MLPGFTITFLANRALLCDVFSRALEEGVFLVNSGGGLLLLCLRPPPLPVSLSPLPIAVTSPYSLSSILCSSSPSVYSIGAKGISI